MRPSAACIIVSVHAGVNDFAGYTTGSGSGHAHRYIVLLTENAACTNVSNVMTTKGNNKEHFTNQRLSKRDQLKLSADMLARVERVQRTEMERQLSPIPRAWIFRKLLALGLEQWEREQAQGAGGKR